MDESLEDSAGGRKRSVKEKERKKIVLASASPRRRELMKLLNMKFEVKTSDEEEVYQSTEPEEIVKELARQK